MNRLEPQTGTGFLRRAGDLLTVVDPTGGQVSDFFALSAADHGEWLSSGRSIDYANTIYLSTGNVLYSNRSRPMATIVADTCGRHDFLLPPAASRPSTCSTRSSAALHTPAAWPTWSRASSSSGSPATR